MIVLDGNQKFYSLLFSGAMINLLATVATIAPHHIAERTLPLLFSALPDNAPARDASTERAKCWLILATLSELCTQANLFEALVSRLMTKVDILCVPKEKMDAQDLEPTSAYAHAILTTISHTLASKTQKGHADIAKYVNRLVPQLFNLFIYSSILSDSQHMAATDHRVVSTAAEIIISIVQALTPQYALSSFVGSRIDKHFSRRQEVLIKCLTDAMFYGNLQGLAEGFQKLPSNKNFDAFEVRPV